MHGEFLDEGVLIDEELAKWLAATRGSLKLVVRFENFLFRVDCYFYQSSLGGLGIWPSPPLTPVGAVNNVGPLTGFGSIDALIHNPIVRVTGALIAGFTGN